MIEFKKDRVYTIIYTMSVREVSRDYPKAKIILLSDTDKDGWTLIAIEERRY